MTNEPLSPRLRALLDAERQRPPAPPGAKAEVAAQLATLLDPPAGSGGGGGAGADAAGRAASAGVAGKVALGVLAGAIAGGAVVAMVLPPRTVVVERPAPPARVEAPSVTPSVETPTTATVPLAAPPPAPARPTPRAPVVAPSASAIASSEVRSRDLDLAAERALLERARSALSRGDGAAALLATAQHEREFARGKLVEEREALAVQGLVAAGRVQEAAERGARFRKAYPQSLLLPIVDQALR